MNENIVLTALKDTFEEINKNGGLFYKGELCKPSVNLVLEMIIKNLESKLAEPSQYCACGEEDCDGDGGMKNAEPPIEPSKCEHEYGKSILGSNLICVKCGYITKPFSYSNTSNSGGENIKGPLTPYGEEVVVILRKNNLEMI